MAKTAGGGAEGRRGGALGAARSCLMQAQAGKPCLLRSPAGGPPVRGMVQRRGQQAQQAQRAQRAQRGAAGAPTTTDTMTAAEISRASRPVCQPGVLPPPPPPLVVVVNVPGAGLGRMPGTTIEPAAAQRSAVQCGQQVGGPGRRRARGHNAHASEHCSGQRMQLHLLEPTHHSGSSHSAAPARRGRCGRGLQHRPGHLAAVGPRGRGTAAAPSRQHRRRPRAGCSTWPRHLLPRLRALQGLPGTGPRLTLALRHTRL